MNDIFHITLMYTCLCLKSDATTKTTQQIFFLETKENVKSIWAYFAKVILFIEFHKGPFFFLPILSICNVLGTGKNCLIEKVLSGTHKFNIHVVWLRIKKIVFNYTMLLEALKYIYIFVSLNNIAGLHKNIWACRPYLNSLNPDQADLG